MSLGEEYLVEYAFERQIAEDIAERIWYEAERGVWTTKDNRILRVGEMTTSHIKNTINYLKRTDEELYEPWIEVFKEELKRREP